MTSPVKLCRTCHAVQSVDNFYMNNKAKSGVMSKCKKCIKEDNRERWQKQRGVLVGASYKKLQMDRDKWIEECSNLNDQLTIITNKYNDINSVFEALVEKNAQYFDDHIGLNNTICAYKTHIKGLNEQLLSVS